MATFSLKPLDNSIEKANANSFVQFQILCDEAGRTVRFKDVEIDLSGFGENVNWSGMTAVMQGFRYEIKGKKLKFISKDFVSFSSGTSFTFRVNKIALKEDIPGPIKISFVFWDDARVMNGHTYVGEEIRITKIRPVIKLFKLDPSIVRKNEHLKLSFLCADVDSVKITYENGIEVDADAVPVVDKSCKGDLEITALYTGKGAEYSTSFQILAKLGDIYASENNIKKVKIFSGQSWETTILSEVVNGKAETSEIIDLVLNVCNEKMWAFGKGKDGLICLWSTTDGLEWAPHYTNNNEKVYITQDLVHRPAVHFAEKIFFVGGSKVDVGNCSSSLIELDYTRTGKTETLNPKEATSIPERSLHSCVVYGNNIWVIGGVDENGNGLNDVWRFDGSKWISVPVPRAFPARCSFSATVHAKGSRQSIWIAGGASGYDGTSVCDIWAYNLEDPNDRAAPAQWTNVQTVNNDTARPLEIADSWLRATSIASLQQFGAKQSLTLMDTSYDKVNETEVTSFRMIQEGASRPVGDRSVIPYSFAKKGNSLAPDWELKADNFIFSSLGFNGCIWTMAIAYRTQNNITYTKLHYLCPAN